MRTWVLLSTALCAAAFAAAAAALLQPELLLEKIPVHWDYKLEPDGWATRESFVGFLLIGPGFMAFSLLLTVLLPRWSTAVRQFEEVFGRIMTLIIAFFGYLTALMIWAAVREDTVWPYCFAIGFFGFFALLGTQLNKIKRNALVGIRTPWTLASDAVWEETHRNASRVWTTAGTLGIVLVLLGVPFWIALAGLLVSVLWSIVDSYRIYRRLQHAAPLGPG